MILLSSLKVGSRMFGLDTPESDKDFIRLTYAPESVFNPKLKTNKTFVIPETNSEGTQIELSSLIGMLSRGDLKVAEAFCSDTMEGNPPLFVHPTFAPYMHRIVEVADGIPMLDTFKKELKRRYSKLWYREVNPKARNYNAEQEYDSKYAAHLYRVIHEAMAYSINAKLTTRSLTTDEEFRKAYLDIKNGVKRKADVYDIVTQQMVIAEQALDNMEDKPEYDFSSIESLYFEIYGIARSMEEINEHA